MRKTIISIMAFLVMSVSPLTAAAATTDVFSVLPSSVDVMYQFDLSKISDLSEFVVDLIKQDLSAEEINLAEKLVLNNTFTMGVDLSEADTTAFANNLNTFISFKVDAADLEDLLNSIDGKYTTSIYKEQKIYNFADSFGVHLNDLFLVTSSEENAQLLIDNNLDDTNSLAKTILFENASKHFLDNAFLNMYLDPNQVLSTIPMNDYLLTDSVITTDEFTQDYLDALLSEVVSVAKTDAGFDFSVFVEGDTEKLSALNMLMNKFEFTPSLYKKLSGEKMMFYSENNNLKGAIDNLLEISTNDSIYQMFYDETASSFKDFFEQELQTDILDLLDGNYIMTAHETGQIFPGFTVIFDSSAHKDLAKANVALLNEKINSYLKNEEEMSETNFYSYGTTTLGADKLPKHIIDLKAAAQGDTTLTTAELRLNITLGVTDDGMIVFSTHPDLGSIWETDPASTGLLSNKGLAESFTDPENVITQIMYLDIDAIGTYLENMMNKTDVPEDPIDLITGILAPWHNLYMTGTATENTASAIGTLNVDIEKLNDYPALFETYDTYLQEQYRQSYLSYSTALQCDVSRDDWFREPVVLLYYDAIISGYDDGCFRPGNEITRAEFTKMVYSAAEMAGLTGSIAMSDQDNYFNDVNSDEWYASYINQAAAGNLVNGYNDGSFHPNTSISRAEAVQILYNASEMIRNQTEERISTKSNFSIPFTDVNLNTDWYGHAVAGMYINQIVAGTPTGNGNFTFDPSRNINRAEAAKIIYQFLELHT